MDRRKSFVLVAFLVIFISIEATIVQAQGKGNGAPNETEPKPQPEHKPTPVKPEPEKPEPKKPEPEKPEPKKPEPEKPEPEKPEPEKPEPKKPEPKPKPAPKKKPPPEDKALTHYEMQKPEPETGRERAICKSRGSCYNKILTCPAECPERKPKKNKRQKGCFIQCGRKCEATCKWRKPKCDGFGSLCYDPRFVGGDGVMFYFHGEKGRSFALVSDTNLQINAHFIGNRPDGRTRDYTWVQALSVMFDTHTLVLAAKRMSKWDDSVDALIVKWDGEEVVIPTDGDSEWRTNTEKREVVVERTDNTNMVRVTVGGLVEVDLKVVPITEADNRIHNYQLPSNDAFAHFETQFKFPNLSDLVEGILGKTYRPDYVSPVKRGVPMPMMGGEDKYLTPSLNSPHCKVCRFQTESEIGIAQY